MSGSAASAHHNGLEVAIIGMAGRFPGARDIHELWLNLRDGVESIAFFSDEELAASGVDPTVLRDPHYVKARGVLEGAEWFDASFFGITPREAEIMDPQHRVFLECAWEALEHAGYDAEGYKGSIGVYAGAGMNTYLLHNLYSNRELTGSVVDSQTSIGSGRDFLATRVSYKLNLEGPSVVVQTACSTSLVAVHLACQSLLSGDCDMALAGGVSISVPQKAGRFYQEGGIYSPDGHCRAFDARAQGTVFSNGVGIVVLKRLQDAIADGDCFHALIKGSAINNDGSSKVGYAAPSVDGQAKVIAKALAVAGVDPETVGYIEAHGTGTALGDPIEIAALTEVFRASSAKKGFCAIGSGKTNVGHLNAAAGVTGLIKTVLALKHKMIPPCLHFERPNPRIDFANSPFYVNTGLSEWPAGGHPRRAGVSAFGIGGTNAHVVLEEAPPTVAPSRSRPWQLLILSAKTRTALETTTTNLAEHFKRHPEVNLADVAYTLQRGRRAFNHRRMLVCRDLQDALTTLGTLHPERVFTDDQESRGRPIVFMFPGQGAQYVQMAFDLYREEPTFRGQVDLCADLLTPHLGLNLRKVLYPLPNQVTEATRQLQQTWITQPALFVIEYALARLWVAWGIHPQALIGHSIGEYVAACLAGVLSLEDALMLVAARGRLMQQLPRGAMLTVPLPEEEVQPLLDQNLALAAINGPSLCVVSGPTAAVETLHNRLTEQGVGGLPVYTSHAFHSAMMDPILEPFTEHVQAINLEPPTIPYVSNVTGTWITAAEATSPRYWARHLRHTVRFAAGLNELFQDPDRILLEVGPGRTLSTLARWHPAKATGQVLFSSLRHPQDQESDVACMLTTLGQLWLAGIQVDWSGFCAGERRQRLPLPTYAFERQRYWIEPPKQVSKVKTTQDFLRKESDIANWFYIPSWKRSLPPMFVDHGDLTKQQSCWLVFSDACGLGAQLIERLEHKGQDVIQVKAGEEFARTGERLYEINPRKPECYKTLIENLRALDKSPENIVHLWSVTSDDPRKSGSEFCELYQDLGFYSLLFLAQALGEHPFVKPVDMGVISNNLQFVTGEERLCPEKATVLGPCKVIPREYPNIVCRNIDIVVPPARTGAQERLVEHLIAELTTNRWDPVVAYRGNQRWVQTFEAMRLENPVKGASRLRQEGVYLITGGLGGVGLVLAKYLAQEVQARLVLIGRSAFPERERWEQWLTSHNEDDVVSCKIREVQAIEQCGGQVLVISADVANQSQMQEAIHLAYARFGHIHGVIHAAGIAGGGIIQLKTPELADRVLAPKLQGTIVLNALFKGVDLDLFMLCSSITSILGGSGQVDYCGANAFLDAFAYSNDSSDGRLLVSINWDTWREVGMAVNTAVPKVLEAGRQERLQRGILSNEGMDAFARILGTRLSQVIVTTSDLRFVMERHQAHLPSPVVEELQEVTLSTSSPSAHPRPELGSPYVAPRNKVEQAIANIWQQLLGIENVGIHDNFLNLGGHSLMALQVVSRVRRTFQVEVSVRVFLEAPTVAGLAEAIVNAQDQAVQMEHEEVARLLAEVEALPDEETRRLLADRPE